MQEEVLEKRVDVVKTHSGKNVFGNNNMLFREKEIVLIWQMVPNAYIIDFLFL